VRPGERSQLIERYVAGRAAVLDALARVPQEALDRAPAGEWSARMIESCVRSNAELFRLLSQKDWRRTGRHSEFGDYTVEYLLQRSAAHPHEHAAQIARLVGQRWGRRGTGESA
jgi:hypothetical protein